MSRRGDLDPVEYERLQDGNRSIAQKIRNRLDQLSNANAQDKRRWIWELLQNAKDTYQDQQVDIEITFSNEVLEFKHNGGYFSPRNVTNLVHQISSKEGTESIGRFGTGFLTTHTLSRLVDVKGVYADKENLYSFNITLDRQGSTEEELIKGIEHSWDSYNPIKIESVQDSWTRFFYKKPNHSVATLTLQDFEASVFYTLAFVKNTLGTIKIEDEVNSKKSEFTLVDEKICTDNLSILQFLACHDDQQDEIYLLYANNSEGVDLVIEIEAFGSTYKIKPIKHNTPRLFCAFPLIGTEDFAFPMVFNSVNFNPKTERDGLYLKVDEGDESNSPESYSDASSNQEIIEKGVLLYEKVLEYVSEQKWFDVYQLAFNSCPPINSDLDENWYKKNILCSIRESLLTVPIVETEAGKRLYISHEEEPVAYFPFHKNEQVREKIWDFVHYLFPDNLPKKQHIHDWHKILWSKEKGLRQTLEKTANDIQNLESLDGLSKGRTERNNGSIEWLNELLGFLSEQEPELLKKYSILPNQYGVFKKKEELYTDQNIPDELKDVLKIIGQDWRDLLLHPSITQVDMTNRYKNVKMLSKAIDEYIDTPNHIKQDDESVYRTEDNTIFNEEEYKQTMFNLASALLQYSALEKPSSEHEQILKFAQTYFDQMPSSIELLEVNQNIDLHSEVFKWLLKYMAVNISSHKNIDNLEQNLNGRVKAIEWLNNFILFTQTHDAYKKLIDLDEIPLLPNQHEVFKRKKELYLDQNIPDELKDILEIIDQDWRDLLLHSSINNVEIRNYKDVEMLSEVINKYIDKCIDASDDVEIDKEQIFDLVSSLLGYSTLAEPSSEHEQIWEFAQTYYLDKIPKSIVDIETSQDVDLHQEAFKWLLRNIAEKISDHKNLDNLSKSIHGHVEVIDWLNTFVVFIQDHEIYRKIVDFDEIPVLPNQDGIFHSKQFLFKDHDIDPDLKDILKPLHPEWVEVLLDPKIDVILPDNQTRSFEDIAKEIDKTFRQKFDQKHTQEPVFINSFQKLLGEHGWMKRQSSPEDVLKNHFYWINENKSELALSILGEGEKKDKIFELLQGGNIEALSEVQKKLSKEELEELANNLDKVQDYLKRIKSGQLVSQITDSGSIHTSSSHGGGNPNYGADMARSNREAKEAVKQYLESRSEYDLSGWRAESHSKTIILGVKKYKTEIKLVIKGADYQLKFDDPGKEHSVLRETFSELWIYSNGSIIQITLGGAIWHDPDSVNESVKITNYEIYALPQDP